MDEVRFGYYWPGTSLGLAIIAHGRGWDWQLLARDEVGIGYYCSLTRLGLAIIAHGRGWVWFLLVRDELGLGWVGLGWVGLGWATTDLDFTRPPPHSINIPEVVSIVNIGTVFNA